MVRIHRETRVTAACATVALTGWYLLETQTTYETLDAVFLLGVGVVLPLLINRHLREPAE